MFTYDDLKVVDAKIQEIAELIHQGNLELLRSMESKADQIIMAQGIIAATEKLKREPVMKEMSLLQMD